MKYLKTTVKLLTFLASFSLVSCSIIYENYGETCKSHAYLNRGLHDFITSRFHSNSPVRMAIIPFSASANLTAKDSERPGLGNEIAWKIHAALLESGEIPILEVFNRQDWPYKKEEFFTGNFGGIAMAREAGYDLVMIGYMEPNGLDQLDAYVKVMDAESGVTVYYGKTSAVTLRPDFEEVSDTLLLTDKMPSQIFLKEISDKLAVCIRNDVIRDPLD